MIMPMTAELAVKIAERLAYGVVETIFDARWNVHGTHLGPRHEVQHEVPAGLFTRLPCEADPMRENPAWERWRWARAACVEEIAKALRSAGSADELMQATDDALRKFRQVALRATLVEAPRLPEVDRVGLEDAGLALARRIQAAIQIASRQDDQLVFDRAALREARTRVPKSYRKKEDRAEADVVVAALLRGEVSADRLRKRARAAAPKPSQWDDLTGDALHEEVARLATLLTDARAGVPGHDSATDDPGRTSDESRIVPTCPANDSRKSRSRPRAKRSGVSSSATGSAASKSASGKRKSKSNPSSGAKRTPRKAAK